MKYLFFIIGFLFIFCDLSFAKIDLNSADMDDLLTLPITPQQAEDIYFYRYYIDYFRSIYDLRLIDSIDQETMNRLKPLVMISFYREDDAAAIRRDEIFYLLERLGTNEGLQEGMSDVWEDYLMTPKNINKMPFSELMNLPNASAIDASAILKRRARGDTISNFRDLRFSPGISYYGARNISYYVYYQEEPIQNKIFIDYQMKYNDSPYTEEQMAMFNESMIRFSNAAPAQKNQSYWGFFNMENNRSAVMHKVRFRLMNEWKAGILTNSEKGDDRLFMNNADNLTDDAKYYLGYERDFDFLGNNYLKIYAGNYRATFGEGLIMENTDSFSPRQTGYGYNKRIIGIIGDLSRTRQYSLRGVALDWKRDNLNAVIFVSNDKKDAVIYDSNNDGILDEDDYALCYINPTINFSNDDLAEAENFFNDFPGNLNNVSIAPRKNAITENLVGTHLEYSPFIGTHVGFTGYEATYDRHFVVPELETLQDILIDDPETADKKWKMTDAEIVNLYSTKTDTYDRNYRRVYGFDWRTTLNNFSFQGEYAEMESDGSFFKFGDDPKAILLSSYTQFENLYFLSIFRHYDLDFDNPYQRSFSESPRFDDTVLERLTYGLRNTLLTDLYINSTQPSAERGVYFETRYQFHRMFTITRAYLDLWERLSDSRRGIRFQGTLEFKPKHQIRIRTRHKVQIKRDDDIMDRGKSQSNETELQFIAYLSNFDRISMGIIHAKVLQPPYLSILSDPGFASAPDMAQAITTTDGEMIYFDYTHNFNENLKINGSFAFWKAFGASFWDFEDVELDFEQSDRGYKYWFTINSRIANNLYLSLKYKYKQFLTRELEYRLYNEIPATGEWYFQRVENKQNILRLQLDWKF